MRSTKQYSFIDLEIEALIPPDDPLKILFNSIDFSFIYPLLKDRYKTTGRQGFDPQCLFKALLLIYLGEATSERDLAHKLRFNTRLSYLTGFSYGNTPSHTTFHYFRKRIGVMLFQEIFMNLIAQAICLIQQKKLSLTIDSSHIQAMPSDTDANWGYKSKDFSFFGYKLHLEVTNTELPLPVSLKVTPASTHDGTVLKPLTSDAREVINPLGKSISDTIADAAYDSTENEKHLLKNNIIPYIAENPRGRKNPLFTGKITITSKGKFLCPAGVELKYWGRETKRKRFKFRCGLYKTKGQGCLFKDTCWKNSYGSCFYLKEDHEVQNFMRVLRSTEEFKRKYSLRTHIERFFSVLKNSHALTRVRFRGIKEITIHVIMSICAYLVRAISGYRTGTGLLRI